MHEQSQPGDIDNENLHTQHCFLSLSIWLSFFIESTSYTQYEMNYKKKWIKQN